MFLKSLELNGFKSFAQKTVLEFPKGITAIVGPNGSGKSNVIDGVRWLLGERDSKNLRGAKIENLIFAGTPKRPRMGIAQVGLFFDNTSGFFPADFNEVSILRRVSRDGASQYFLNKSEVRLKDIIDFFARARLGTKGLTIINQGNSDLFVRATSEERRAMVEEVLGLREFQIKKSEAERKLENTGFNLEKVKAIIEEVVPRLKMLKRQTIKWEKRAEVERELKELEDYYFSDKLGEIRKENGRFDAELKEVEKIIIEKSKELKILEEEVKKIESTADRSNFNEIKIKKNGLFGRQMNIQKEISRLEARLEIFENKAENEIKTSQNDFQKEDLLELLKNARQRLEGILSLSEFKEVLAAIEKLFSEIDGFLKSPDKVGGKDGAQNNVQSNAGNMESENLIKQKSNLLEEIKLVENEVKNLEKVESEIALGLEEFNKRFQKSFEAVEHKKDEVLSFENKQRKIVFEKEKLNLRLEELKNHLAQAGRHLKEFDNISEAENREVGVYDADIEKKIFRLRAELAHIGEIDESLLKEADATEKHYNFLSAQVADLEKAAEDLNILIEELKEKIDSEFNKAFHSINEKFDHFFKLMFKGGHAKLKLKTYDKRPMAEEEISQNPDNINNTDKAEKEIKYGVEIELNLPKKKISSLEMLSGGEKSLVSIAALFALISVSPPPFLVLDEIDAALDEKNSKMFADLIKDFSHQTQFIIVTHNRSVMETADVLYGVTMNDDGTSKLLSLKLDGVDK